MTNSFRPRDWQDRMVREYQTNLKNNFLVEACTSAGKTGGALYAYNSLRDVLGLRFLVAVVPGDHLKRQYAKDATNLFQIKLFNSGIGKLLAGPSSLEELLHDGYHGIVVNYQWLTKPDNAQKLSYALKASFAGKVFVILDEVHHASEKRAFGRACEIAFPDDVVAHRLMTSGTPFRSDKDKILGNWVNYIPVEGENDEWECLPDFRYTLGDALNDEIIPVFSFVTLTGIFSYLRWKAHYEGKTFTNAQSNTELADALNTAIYVEGDWVKAAIEWAHERMKRDRQKGKPECATYIRVHDIPTARRMKERVFSLTGENALVVVSKRDDPSGKHSYKQNSSELIEKFAAQRGANACSWIIGVGMLGEGVSIERLKYRIYATNICKPLTFRQDLGRLLRLFPRENPEPVETLIPDHPTLIELTLDLMNEIAHVVQGKEVDAESTSNQNYKKTRHRFSSDFEPIASTGELGMQIVEGEEIPEEYTKVAEWAIANKPIWRDWGKTPAHLALMLQEDDPQFNLLLKQYQEANFNKTSNTINLYTDDVPIDFTPEYASWLPDEKVQYARQQTEIKVEHLAYLLYPHSALQFVTLVDYERGSVWMPRLAKIQM